MSVPQPPGKTDGLVRLTAVLAAIFRMASR